MSGSESVGQAFEMFEDGSDRNPRQPVIPKTHFSVSVD
jgi:hypothetical protein